MPPGPPPQDDNPGGADAGGLPPRRAVRPKDAASLILWKDGPRGIEILMGRRHHSLRFMPGVLVFPGGRVDPDDHRARPISPLQADTLRMLKIGATPARATALAHCALRELHEEAGLVVGRMEGETLRPDFAPLSYLTRAITPADRPIRFHARFLIAEARHATGEIRGSGELEEIRFFALTELHKQPVAKITAMILAEFESWLATPAAERVHRQFIRIQGRDSRMPEKLPLPDIRNEGPGDAKAIAELVTAAFRRAEHSSGTEAAIVAALRDAGALTVSLVAVEAGEILGHVAFSPVMIDSRSDGWFGLGPVAVHPHAQHRGIGAALIRAGLRRLQDRHAQGCVVLGDPAYYGRFGFVSDPALHYAEVPPEYFQRLVFQGPAPAGEAAYHDGFNAV